MVGPAAAAPDKLVDVQFSGSSLARSCNPCQLCLSWPPPPLPGGFKRELRVYYVGQDGSFQDGDRFEYGALGPVADGGPVAGHTARALASAVAGVAVVMPTSGESGV